MFFFISRYVRTQNTSSRRARTEQSCFACKTRGCTASKKSRGPPAAQSAYCDSAPVIGKARGAAPAYLTDPAQTGFTVAYSRGLSPHSALSPLPLETGTCTLDSVVECCNLLAYTHILTITIFYVKIWYTGHSPLQNDRRSRTGICVNSDADIHSGRRACSARNL